MEDSYERIGQLLDELRKVEEGPEQTNILRQVIRHADLIGDRQYQFRFRAAFVESAFYSGNADEMLVALSWCLACYDESPEDFGSPEVAVQLMSYALGYITNFPTVSRNKINGLLDDFEKRCLQASIGLRRMYLHRTRIAFWTGEIESAKKYFASFLNTSRRGGWSEDYERVFRVDYYAHVGDDAMACQEAESVVAQTGRAEGPQFWVCAFVIASLVRQNRLDDAKRSFERGYEASRSNPKYLGLVSKHMNYLLSVGELQRAFELFQRHAVWADESSVLDNRFRFCAVGWRLFQLFSENGTKTLKVQLPKRLTPRVEVSEFEPTELAAWFESETIRIAKLFNQRNGNDWYTKSTDRIMNLTPKSA